MPTCGLLDTVRISRQGVRVSGWERPVRHQLQAGRGTRGPTQPKRPWAQHRRLPPRRRAAQEQPAGLVSHKAKAAQQPRDYCAYDPHLSPRLIWAGEPGQVNVEVKDAAGVEVDAVSLHIHERVSTQAFVSALQKLARALRGTLNKDLFDQLTGRISLPFQPGDHRRIAVKVIDQRGNEVLRVVGVDP